MYLLLSLFCDWIELKTVLNRLRAYFIQLIYLAIKLTRIGFPCIYKINICKCTPNHLNLSICQTWSLGLPCIRINLTTASQITMSGISLVGVGCGASTVISSSSSNCWIVGTWSLHFIGHHPGNLLQRLQHSRMQESWKTCPHSIALRFSVRGIIGCWQIAHGSLIGRAAAVAASSAAIWFSSSTEFWQVVMTWCDWWGARNWISNQIFTTISNIWLVSSVCTLSLSRLE